MSKEDYQASQRRPTHPSPSTGQTAKPPTGKPPVGSTNGRQGPTNVNQANANATFNSFIDENTPQWQTEIASAYSQVCY